MKEFFGRLKCAFGFHDYSDDMRCVRCGRDDYWRWL